MRKNILFIFIVIFTASMVEAASVTLVWDPNFEADLGGYKLHWGTTSPGAYTTSVDVNNVTSHTIPGLERGRTYFFAATAYNLTGGESGYSNEVAYTLPSEYPLDGTFAVSPGDTVNTATDIITVSVPTLPASPKSYFWKKTGLACISGQMISVRITAFGPGPVSLVAQDALGCISSEYVLPVSPDARTFTMNIPLQHPSAAFELMIYTGHAAGNYKFSMIDIEVLDNPYPAVETFHIRQLKAFSTTGAKYKAVLQMAPEVGATGQEISVYTKISDLMSDINPIAVYYLTASATLFDFEIFTSHYGGLYFAHRTIYPDGESEPVIASHLPGNVIGHGGETFPPLYFEQKVDAADYNQVFAWRANTPVPAATDQAASSLQLANNYLLSTSASVITTQDLALVSQQKLAGAKLK